MESIKTYNVVCVSKRYAPLNSFVEPHAPMTGKATVRFETIDGFTAIGAIVEFNGVRGRLQYVRAGLDGQVLVIAMEVRDGKSLCWELYTDTLVVGATRERFEWSLKNAEAAHLSHLKFERERERETLTRERDFAAEELADCEARLAEFNQK